MTDASTLTPLQRAGFALKQMRAELDRHTEPIAIVGMACRYPGGANDPRRYWSLLDEGREALVEIPPDRWNAEALYHPQPQAGQIWQSYMRTGNFLDHRIDGFDAEFFRISPREAAAMDPQQRLLLEVAWEALEQAGIPATNLRETNTGVYIGLITGDYGRVPFEEVVVEDLPYYGTGNAISFPAGRLSYFLGLQGPCMVVATACSSTLVSTHLAMQALRGGECDVALSGGVSLMIHPDTSVVLARMNAISRGGRSRTFDAGADGFGRGEGCGVLVLKRLSDARRDGDRIHALLRGSAINHDGPSGGLTVPHGPAQEKLLRAALASARLDPAAIDYIEAHGTGTPLGDPIEVRAIDAVFGRGGRDRDLLVGSVKTNIGHLEAAAGVAGVMKLALALEHERLPASLHFDTPNPAFDWDASPVKVVAKPRPWPRSERERVAGVSSYGLSGINAHVIVSEAPRLERGPTQPRAVELLPLSGKTGAALHELAQRWIPALEQADEAELADLCHTARVGRSALEFRAAVVGSDRAALLEGLRALPQTEQPVERGKLALLFTGQGSQAVDMGRELFASEPGYRATVERCAALLDPKLERPLLEVLFPESGHSPIDETRWAHVGLFTLEYALARLLLDWGVRPDYLLGHSLGEFAAACLAGVFELEDALHLVEARGRLMQSITRPGAMVAVARSAAELGPLLAPFADQVAIASENAPDSVVLSGDRPTLEGLVVQLESRGIRCRRLAVSHAFHSPLIDPILDAFEAEVAGVERRLPSIPIVSSLFGRPKPEALLEPSYWRRHARETVAFASGVRWLADHGVDCFVEVGPRPVLSGLGRQCVPEPSASFVPTLGREDDATGLARALAAVFAAGQDLDWRAYDADRGYRRTTAPTYPWQRRRHWLELPDDYLRRRYDERGQSRSGHPLLGRRLELAHGPAVFQARIGAQSPRWLADHRVFGVPVFPGAGFVEAFLAAGQALLETDALLLEKVEFVRALSLPSEGLVTLQIVAEREAEGWTLAAYSQSPGQREWVVRARAEVRALVASEDPVGPSLPRGPAPDDGDRAARFYELAGALGLDYGPSFRPIRALAGQGERCRGRLELPAELAEDPGPWLWHPILGDGALQVLGAVFPDHVDEDVVHLPVAIDRVVLRGPVGAAAVVEAQVGADASARWADFAIYVDDEGEPRVRVEGVRFQPASVAALRAEVGPGTDDWWYVERWIQRDRPQRSQADAPRTWLLIGDADRRQLASQLGAALGQLGETFVCAVDETQAALAERIAALPEAAGVVDLRLLGLTDADQGIDACLAALALIRVALDRPRPPRLAWLSSGAVNLAVDSGEVDLVPAAAAVHGALRVAAREHAELELVLLDIDDPQRDLDALANELATWPSTSPEQADTRVVLRAGARHVARLERLELAPPSQPVTLDPQGAYLVSGGTRGIGAQLLAPLVDAGARILILASRSGVVAPEAEAELARLRERGVRIETRALDVADRPAVVQLVESIEAEIAPIRGVVHSAGVLDDAAALELDADRFARVFGPKVRGALNLEHATRGRTLDLFVLFSSTATTLASAGQANYVAANAYIEAIAARRRHAKLPGTAIAWGAWDEVGMAARAGIGPSLRRRGMHPIAPASGRACFAQAIQAGPIQATVAAIDWRRMSEAASDPLFAAFAVAPTPGPSANELRTLLERCPPEARHAELTAFVMRAACRILGRAELGPQQRFFELGMDSLMTVELRDELQRGLGTPLPATVAVENSTVASLTVWLEQNVPGLASPSSSSPAAELEPDSPPDSPPDDLDQLFDAVRELPDADIRAQLRAGRRAT